MVLKCNLQETLNFMAISVKFKVIAEESIVTCHKNLHNVMND